MSRKRKKKESQNMLKSLIKNIYHIIKVKNKIQKILCRSEGDKNKYRNINMYVPHSFIFNDGSTYEQCLLTCPCGKGTAGHFVSKRGTCVCVCVCVYVCVCVKSELK